MPKKKLLENLNENQKIAVTTTEGRIRVIAGAGSGKTKTLTHRIAYLIDELGIPSNRIMAVTFTNYATNEMRNRLKNLVGDTLPHITTFHSLGVKILREEIHYLHFPNTFSVLNVTDKKQLLQEIYKSLSLKIQDLAYKDAFYVIEKLKQNINYVAQLTNPDYTHLQNALNHACDIEHKIFYAYLIFQRKSYSLDYDDLINFPLYIFRTEPKILMKWQKLIDYIQVDEFQDTCRYQYEIVDLLSQYSKNLYVVGDPDQTIYSWRGARVDLILDFDKMYPDAQTIVLNKNYRSNPGILHVSNALIHHNQQRYAKDLMPVKTGIATVHHYHAKDPKQEAEWIANRIKSLLDNGIKVDDIAVLFRSHYVSRIIEEVFLTHKIPYMLYNGPAFYDRQEIQDVLGYLHLINNDDDLSFLRVINTPCRRIGKKKIALLQSYASERSLTFFKALEALQYTKEFRATHACTFFDTIIMLRQQSKQKTLSELINQVIQVTGYEKKLMLDPNQDRLDNIKELLASIAYFEKSEEENCTLADYLAKIALYTESDKKKIIGVKMMTVHTAKGLEFPVVFISGLNEGIFPNAQAKTREAVEEERRLMYVAITRAEEHLYLTNADGLNFDNSLRTYSRFLFEIDPQLYSREGVDEEAYQKELTRYKNYNQTKSSTDDSKINKLLRPGTRVNHIFWGKGVIQNINDTGHSYTICFEKQAREREIAVDFSGLTPEITE